MPKPLEWMAAKAHFLLSGIALITIAINSWIYLELTDAGNQAWHCDRHRISMFDYDEYLQKAANMWSDFSHEPVDHMKKDSYPNVIELKNEVCVSLTPFGLGGEPVYCFDKQTKKPTYVFQDVE